MANHTRGHPLEELIDRNQRISPERSKGGFRDRLVALESMHPSEVIHGNIEPDSVVVVVDNDDRPRLVEISVLPDPGYTGGRIPYRDPRLAESGATSAPTCTVATRASCICGLVSLPEFQRVKCGLFH